MIDTYFKGKICKNLAAKEHTGWLEIIGIYGSKRGELSFSMKEPGGSDSVTRWWFQREDINKNLVFKDKEVDRYYKSEKYLSDLNTFKNSL